MAQIRLPDPALLIIAAFSRHLSLLAAACDRVQAVLGPVTFASLPYDFTQTRYYEPAMGSGLKKYFLVLQDLITPDRLPGIKIWTNEIEEEFAAARAHAELRPLNLDPGILTLGKFMLATTKDQAHRIYLRDGIYAEVTLRFEGGQFLPCPWTYADYRQACVLAFMKEARDLYRRSLADEKHRLQQGGGR